MSCVTVKEDNGVVEVILNRPEKHNSLSMEMFEELVSVGDTLMRDNTVKVVVLHGEGPSFCAGLDLSLMKEVADPSGGVVEKLLEVDEDGLSLAQRSAYIWKLIPAPVICSIHGVAFGGGCQIALGADIRIISPESKMGILESKYGLVPDLAITQTLPHLVPQDIALELTMTGRAFSGVDAVDYGLATKLAKEPLVEALALAREMVGRSPSSIKSIKKLYSTVWQEGSKSGLSMERELQRELIGSPNQVEAVAAAMEKRMPKFKDA